MTAVVALSEAVRLVLLAPAPAPWIAAATLARHLAIPPGLALHRLSCVPGALAEGLPRDHATRLARLLAVLGLRVRIEADLPLARAVPPVDLAVQALEGCDLPRLAARLHDILDPSEPDLLVQLQQPGGLILRAAPVAVQTRLTRALRRLRAVRIAYSCPEAAVFDLFPRAGTLPDRALHRHLARLGLRPSPFHGALAAGMDLRTARHVLARFGSGVFALERAFQRLDLYLTGADTMAPVDLAAFLSTRLPQARLRHPGAAEPPLRLETNLSWAAARQFQSDYDLIGLQTTARLSGLGRIGENP